MAAEMSAEQLYVRMAEALRGHTGSRGPTITRDQAVMLEAIRPIVDAQLVALRARVAEVEREYIKQETHAFAVRYAEQQKERADAAEAKLAEVEQERDWARFTLRYGTPFDPTGARTGTEIQGLRASLAAAERRAEEFRVALVNIGDKRDAAERRAEEMQNALALAALPLEALQAAGSLRDESPELAMTIKVAAREAIAAIRATLAPPPAPATCWWDAEYYGLLPAMSHRCPLHGASVFLCPRRPEGV